ncbi:MAG: efflux RND transporter periplasmic adaptor subunit [Bacteroidetes bacterium]|nr:efflux RND transporter periplasmic adaptor subunit [Bacteroidota bacterium]
MKALLIFLFLLLPGMTWAHGDEPHGAAPAAALTPHYFSTESTSDKYELLLKYEFLKPGSDAHLRLFIADANSNLPVDSARLHISMEGLNEPVSASQSDKGMYLVHAVFPKIGSYKMDVQIEAAQGPDLIQLSGIQAGIELPKPEAIAPPAGKNAPWLFAVLGLGLGGLLVWLMMRSRDRRLRRAVAIAATFLMLPFSAENLRAHGDEDHGAGASAPESPTFLVAKETQFLFGVTTEARSRTAFNESTPLYGTVLPASNGAAVIHSPQAGRIVKLFVRVGESLKQGQPLMQIEQSVDASTRLELESRRAAADAEWKAARAQYERLKSIADIAAKRDLSEAKARMDAAAKARNILDAGGAAGLKSITLSAPIDGIAGPFTLTPGTIVNAGDTLLNITNLNRVYVEAQVYDKDVDRLYAAGKFTVECTDREGHKTQSVKLLARAQSVLPSNQSQRVLFEVNNPEGDFKIGEFVNVRVFAGSSSSSGLSVPNSALTELSGKPAVFVKQSAERYSVVYVSTGQNNGTYTLIQSGLNEGQKIVTEGVYPLKMIYLNQ